MCFLNGFFFCHNQCQCFSDYSLSPMTKFRILVNLQSPAKKWTSLAALLSLPSLLILLPHPDLPPSTTPPIPLPRAPHQQLSGGGARGWGPVAAGGVRRRRGAQGQGDDPVQWRTVGTRRGGWQWAWPRRWGSCRAATVGGNEWGRDNGSCGNAHGWSSGRWWEVFFFFIFLVGITASSRSGGANDLYHRRSKSNRAQNSAMIGPCVLVFSLVVFFFAFELSFLYFLPLIWDLNSKNSCKSWLYISTMWI